MFVKFLRPTYIWTGPGRSDDAIWVGQETVAMELSFYHEDPARITHYGHVKFYLLMDGRIGWTLFHKEADILPLD